MKIKIQLYCFKLGVQINVLVCNSRGYKQIVSEDENGKEKNFLWLNVHLSSRVLLPRD